MIDQLTRYDVVNEYNQDKILEDVVLTEVNDKHRNYWEATHYDEEDQSLIDSILRNCQDILSNNVLFNRLKDYEAKFRSTSQDFFEKWSNGETQTNPEIHDWMAIHRSF